jgi:hypothetical protein
MMRIVKWKRANNLLLIAIAVITSVLIGPGVLIAQKCGDAFSDSDLKSFFRSIIEDEHKRNPELIYRVVAIVGKRAIPELRRIRREVQYGENACDIQDAAQAALAKLGDRGALEELEQSLNIERKRHPAIDNLAFVGSDSAISILMNYLIAHEFDESRHVDHGDYIIDPLKEIIDALYLTTFGKRIPASQLPTRDKTALFAYAPFLQELRNWFKNHKGEHLSLPIYANVSNPRLKCLATMVDWGIPNSILAMAEVPDNEAGIVIRQYPRMSREDLGTTWGNVDAALARLGDKKILTELAIDLKNEYRSLRERALAKLRFAGNKAAVEAMVNVLGLENQAIPIKEYPEYQQTILRALARIIKHPPLKADAEPSSENFAIWKKWWAKNKQRAIFKQQTFDY